MLYTFNNSIVLGFFSISHLGDAMCTTTLPRKIFRHLGKMVYVVHHPSTVAVFANNPYVAGFKNEGCIRLVDKLSGYGHIIQKLERGFGLPVDPVPKPELYFSDAELEWAWSERQKWPQDKPICLLSTGTFTDSIYESYTNLHWNRIRGVLSKYFTIIYPMITSLNHYKKQASLTYEMKNTWRPDIDLKNVVTYRDISLRQYLVLFTVTDYHFGPTAGGAQVAAALEIPSIIILNRHAEKEDISFPNTDRGLTIESFFYPQHVFLRTNDLYPDTFDSFKFTKIVKEFVERCSGTVLSLNTGVASSKAWGGKWRNREQQSR